MNPGRSWRPSLKSTPTIRQLEHYWSHSHDVGEGSPAAGVERSSSILARQVAAGSDAHAAQPPTADAPTPSSARSPAAVRHKSP